MRTIDIYENNAGYIYLHRRGDRHVVIRGNDFDVTAQEELPSYEIWGGTELEAESNGFETFPVGELGDEDLIAHYDGGDIAAVRKPGLAGLEYLDLPRDD